MSLDTTKIIDATEGILSLVKMADRLNDFGTYRHAQHHFQKMLANEVLAFSENLTPDWDKARAAIDELHTAACDVQAEQFGGFKQVGSVNILSQKLIAAAAVMGFTLYDAIPINPEIQAAE